MKFPYKLAPFKAPEGTGGGGTDPEPNTANANTPEPTPPANPAPAAPNPAPADNRSQFIPRERFDDVNTKYRTLQDTHSALATSYQTALSERETAKNEATTANERATRLETVLSEMLTARLKAIPEDKRDLVPEGLTVDQKLLWLEKATAKGIFAATNQQPQQPIGAPTNPAPGGQAVNLDNLSPLAKLTAGYGSKRT